MPSQVDVSATVTPRLAPQTVRVSARTTRLGSSASFVMARSTRRSGKQGSFRFRLLTTWGLPTRALPAIALAAPPSALTTQADSLLSATAAIAVLSVPTTRRASTASSVLLASLRQSQPAEVTFRVDRAGAMRGARCHLCVTLRTAAATAKVSLSQEISATTVLVATGICRMPTLTDAQRAIATSLALVSFATRCLVAVACRDTPASIAPSAASTSFSRAR